LQKLPGRLTAAGHIDHLVPCATSFKRTQMADLPSKARVVIGCGVITFGACITCCKPIDGYCFARTQTVDVTTAWRVSTGAASCDAEYDEIGENIAKNFMARLRKKTCAHRVQNDAGRSPPH
jgi:hypothetical protein